MFEHLVWKDDRMMIKDLVFRLELSKNHNWDLGDRCFQLFKDWGMMQSYDKVFTDRPDFQAKNILELGIWDGGSMAIWADTFYPVKLVGIDWELRQNSAYFADYLKSRGLVDSVKSYWGIDQSDLIALEQVLEKEFDGPLDLVVDDASHKYEQTKISFQYLFPRLRTGGLYIIEDWSWAHWPSYNRFDHPNFGAEVELTKLIVEITEMIGSAKDKPPAYLSVFPGIAVIEKGEFSLETNGKFHLEDHIVRRTRSNGTAPPPVRLLKPKSSTMSSEELIPPGSPGAHPSTRADEEEEWLNTLIRSVRRAVVDGRKLPGFPDEALQTAIGGTAGEATLRHAYPFYLKIKESAGNLGIDVGPRTRILDFGCAWGRHLRFFLKDVAPENLYGTDIDPAFIDWTRRNFPLGHFTANNKIPPLIFPDAQFDIVYAYSVFSHLNEEHHLRWMQELARVLRPGGMLLITTQGREFLDFCASFLGRTEFELEWFRLLATVFSDSQDVIETKSRFDNGEFIYLNHGGGGYPREGDFYGEAIVPRQFFEAHWTGHFRVVDFFDPLSGCAQVEVVAQRL